MIEIDGIKWAMTSEVADILHVSPKTIRNMVYTGRLKSYRRLGIKESLFKLLEVEALLTPRPTKLSPDA